MTFVIGGGAGDVIGYLRWPPPPPSILNGSIWISSSPVPNPAQREYRSTLSYPIHLERIRMGCWPGYYIGGRGVLCSKDVSGYYLPWVRVWAVGAVVDQHLFLAMWALHFAGRVKVKPHLSHYNLGCSVLGLLSASLKKHVAMCLRKNFLFL